VALVVVFILSCHHENQRSRAPSSTLSCATHGENEDKAEEEEEEEEQ